MEYLVVVATALMLAVLVQVGFASGRARVLLVLAAAFAARLAVHVLVLRGGLLEYGGDNYIYESRAFEVVAYWKVHGLSFVTSEQIADLYSVSVPCNVFALVIYLCGGPATLACTSVVALVACATAVAMYRFARVIGADERAAFRLLVVTAFLPVFLLHTSDMFKDGFNAFLIVACLGLAASNVRRFDVRKLLLLAPLLWALWNVRPYMVFMCALPLFLGAVGARRALSLTGLALLVGLLTPVLVFPGATENSAVVAMQEQLERGQSQSVRISNAQGGSGVVFDDGGNAWNALLPKVLYTLLSPFPWTGGSMTLQIAKLDTLLWYLLLFHGMRGFRLLWRHARKMALILALFAAPCTIVYATTMSNMGLIYRQRLPIVLVVSLLAAASWSRARPREAAEPAEATADALSHR
ncbi:hypothetical protein [Microbispora sp. H10836]|uniref:hypothetical protein n=1 Tax=Microbispora sp. H10836 TaxID=2729106 RepID=UPI00147675BD|nr:hypothetical protein [Microbispora sp. H10836]